MAATTGTDDKKEMEFEMEYRTLGGTGLKVSCVGLGTMTFDTKDHAKEIMSIGRKAGINFFDGAEAYGTPIGNCEKVFGEALAELQKEDSFLWRRSDLVITTKIFWGPNGDPKQSLASPQGANEAGTSAKHIYEGVNGALKRLQLDYVDVVFAHRMDPLTPTLETVRAFTQVIRDGKAFYWGTSMWPAQKITEAYWLAHIHNLIPPVVEQPVYNMLKRTVMEKDYVAMFEKPYSIGTTIWSPLEGGVLTGKYNKELPKDSRIGGSGRLAMFYAGRIEQLKKSGDLDKIDKLLDFCKNELNGASMVSLAVAWCLKNKNVSTCLLGASKASQMQANLDAVTLARKLTNEQMDAINKILDNGVPVDRNLNLRAVKKLIQTYN